MPSRPSHIYTGLPFEDLSYMYEPKPKVGPSMMSDCLYDLIAWYDKMAELMRQNIRNRTEELGHYEARAADLRHKLAIRKEKLLASG